MPSASPQPSTSTPPSRQALKVLVIDDDSFQLSLLSELLRGLGIAGVTCVSSGREGMQQVTAAPAAFDLILIDLYMPGMDGFEFMDSLARANYTGAMVIVSGQSDDVLRGATLVARLRRFTLLGTLRKPVERAALSALIAGLSGR
ncbi:MAG: response regulator [Rhodoferax sp.]|nr:response regulator [Rhodoferax sp.]